MPHARLHTADCLTILRDMADDSIDSVVTDPPYGLNFMGQKWDAETPKIEICKELLRVLKPGGHLIMFGGPRTYHRMAVAVEDAGFEIRDQLLWLYGSGFPKGNKAIGNAVDSQEWDGWGTILKPAHEPAVLARKPFKGTVDDNVLDHGTGALNVDGCRVEGYGANWKSNIRYPNGYFKGFKPIASENTKGGRWPANLCHDGSEAVDDILGDKSRYFYCGKISSSERNAGLEGFGSGVKLYTNIALQERPNHHPTVKPIALMRWMCRLITPPGGAVLDPFMGSGSTGCAAVLEGFDFIGVDMEQGYVDIAQNRIDHYRKCPGEPEPDSFNKPRG